MSKALEYQVEWLGSFVGVAEHGGFSAAAAALSRSQSRVSAHVAALEKALRMRLFDRSAHPAVLTPEGRALLPHARMVLRRTQSLTSTAAAVRQGRRGEIRLGVHTLAAPFLVPRAVSRVQRSHPQLRLVVRELGPSELERRLLEGWLDLAVSPGAAPAGAPGAAQGAGPVARGGELTGVRLWRGRLVAVVPDEEAAGLPAPLRPEDLAARPLAVLDDGDGADGAAPLTARGPFAGAAVGNAPVFRTPHPQTLVGLVQQGWGLGVGDVLALSTAGLTGVTLRPLAGLPPGRDVSLWWRTDRTVSPAREAAAHCVRIAAVPATARMREVAPNRAEFGAPDCGR